MIITNSKLLRDFRNKQTCEWCLLPLRYAAHPHHIRTVGEGRMDVSINLIALGGPFDCACHSSHHDGNEVDTYSLEAIVAVRENVSRSALRAVTDFLLRTSAKETETYIRIKLAELPGAARDLATRVLIRAGKLDAGGNR